METRTHDQCGDTIEKSQAPDDGCINVRNMLSIEEVKLNLASDIKLVSYSSTITMMHGPIYIRFTWNDCSVYCITIHRQNIFQRIEFPIIEIYYSWRFVT